MVEVKFYDNIADELLKFGGNNIKNRQQVGIL